MLCAHWHSVWRAGTPVGREKVSARVILLRVGLATLRLAFCIFISTQLMGRAQARARSTYSIEDEAYEGCVSGCELATGG